jgi:cytochrome b involved in lipid metabolism
VFSLGFFLLQHSTASSCWFVIRGIVYDVTTFLEDHPGGDDVLKGSAKGSFSGFFAFLMFFFFVVGMSKTFWFGVLKCLFVDKAGKDATQAFEDIGHSPEAEQQMTKYAIGKIKGGSKATADKKKSSSAGTTTSKRKRKHTTLLLIVYCRKCCRDTALAKDCCSSCKHT